jgi:uncharacterized damage-inducible protein DinB
MQALIEEFAAGGSRLRSALQGLTDEQCRARPGPGKWSIHELVIHLQDSDAVGLDRMRRVISHDNPPLLAYDESLFVERLACDAQSRDDAVVLFEAGRRQMTRILRALSADDFSRPGRHSESGEQTLETLVRTYIQHLEHHLQFLRQKRERLGVPLPSAL